MSISVSRPLIAGLLVGLLGVGHANAALISGTGAPSANAALAGSTTIDFSATSTGTYSSLALAGVTIDAAPGKTFIVTDNLGGSYNTTGRNLQNLQVPGSTGQFVLSFSSQVSAFAFNFGASNENWLLEALDAGSSVLESHTLSQTWWSNGGEYFGIATTGIASARLTQLTHVNDAGIDWVLMDNLAFVPGESHEVPAPGALALVLLGLAGLPLARRRRAVSAD